MSSGAASWRKQEKVTSCKRKRTSTGLFLKTSQSWPDPVGCSGACSTPFPPQRKGPQAFMLCLRAAPGSCKLQEFLEVQGSVSQGHASQEIHSCAPLASEIGNGIQGDWAKPGECPLHTATPKCKGGWGMPSNSASGKNKTITVLGEI